MPRGAPGARWRRRPARCATRSTMTLAVPVSTVTRVSFTPSDSTSLMSRTLPMMPPLVITSSPFLRLAQQLRVLLPRLARRPQDEEVEHEADRRHLQHQDGEPAARTGLRLKHELSSRSRERSGGGATRGSSRRTSRPGCAPAPARPAGPGSGCCAARPAGARACPRRRRDAADSRADRWCRSRSRTRDRAARSSP